MNWLSIIEAIVGVGETVVPIFIHNPQSQKIEGVIVSSLNGVMTGLANAGVTGLPGTTTTTLTAKTI